MRTSSSRPPRLAAPTSLAAAILLAWGLGALTSGCSVFIVLAREARGTGDDGIVVVGQPVSGDTNGGTDAVTPGCGAGRGTPERRYFFTASETRRYVASTESSYDAVLAIYPHGGTGEPIACNDDDGSTARSRVPFDAVAGETYDVVVDGFSSNRGAFTLWVRPESTEDDPPVVAAGTLAIDAPVSGTTVGGPDLHVLSCGAATPGTPDATYTFTPGESGTYTFRTLTDYDGTLEVFDGEASLGCNDDDGSTRASRITTGLSAGRTYTVVVDGFGSGQGNYTLSVVREGSRPAIAGALTVGAPVQGSTVGVVRPTGPIAAGQTVQGSTLGGSDTRVPPCGSQPGTPDQIWTFTAPVTATYRLHVDSDYDGVLAVYPVGAPDPLMCNDDAGSTRASEIEGSLIAGQAYEIVVDGYAGGEGSYTLRLDMLSGVGGAPVAPPSTIRPSIHGGPMPENLREMDARCAAAQPITTGRYTGVIEPAEAAAQLTCGAGGAGGDLVYALTLPAASEVFFHVAADFEVGLEVRSGCTSGVERCVAAPAQTGTDVTVSLGAGAHFVVLDAMDGGARGPVYLDVHVRPAPAPASTP